MRNFAAFSSWFCIFKSLFMRLRLLKLLFLLDSDWQTSRWWQRGVEERHVTRFQLRSMTDVVFARFGGCLVSLLDG